MQSPCQVTPHHWLQGIDTCRDYLLTTLQAKDSFPPEKFQEAQGSQRHMAANLNLATQSLHKDPATRTLTAPLPL